jgi:hypothetical protein
MDKFLQAIHDHGLLNEVSITQQTYFVCNKPIGSDFEVMKDSQFELSIPKSVPKEKVDQLSSTLEKL